MRLFDVVLLVDREAMTSIPPGRWNAGYSFMEKDARRTAERYNSCSSTVGIRYDVEEHDEECTGRAKHYSDTHETTACTCKKAVVARTAKV